MGGLSATEITVQISREIHHFVQSVLSFLFIENRNLRFSAEKVKKRKYN